MSSEPCKIKTHIGITLQPGGGYTSYAEVDDWSKRPLQSNWKARESISAALYEVLMGLVCRNCETFDQCVVTRITLNRLTTHEVEYTSSFTAHDLWVQMQTWADYPNYISQGMIDLLRDIFPELTGITCKAA